MPDFAIYLLKASFVLALVYAAYWLLLRKLTFYTYNRFFLLSGIGAALCIPLLDVSALVVPQTQLGNNVVLLLPEWRSGTATEQQPEQVFGLWEWMIVVYGIGLAVLGIRFILQLRALWQLHRTSAPATYGGVSYREMPVPLSPYSFGRSIYLHTDNVTDKELRALLLHEQTHIKQLHTLDTILGQLVKIILWFNPFAWLLQQAIRQNLEYLADEQVLAHGLDSKTYQYSLVHISQPSRTNFALMTRFNLNPIKDRIMMMNKPKTNPMQKLKYALLAPAIITIALAATASYAQVGASAQSIAEPIQAASQDTTKNLLNSADANGKVYVVDGVKSDAAAVKKLDKKKVKSTRAVMSSKPEANKAGNPAKSITIATTEAGEQTLAAQDMNHKVDAMQRQDNLVSISVVTTKDVQQKITDENQQGDKAPIYFLDGKRISAQEVKMLLPDNIASIDVWKGEKAKEKYGEEAKNGAVLITSKK